MAEQEPRQPSSYADLGIEMIRTLGKLGPVTIVVGGLLFAAYMFYQALTEAQLKADLQNQRKLEAAQQALVETYDSISALSQKQLSNVQQMLELHDSVANATEQRRNQLEKLQQEAEAEAKLIRAEAEAAKAEAEIAQAEAEQAGVEAEELKAAVEKARDEAEALRRESEKMALLREQTKRELVKLEEDRVTLQNERDKVQADLDRRRQSLNARAQEIEQLKRQLDELASMVVAASEEEVSLREIKRLAEGILDRNATQQPRKLLLAAAQSPGADSVAALKELDGLKEEVLRPLLEEGLGFAGWMRLADDTTSEVSYFGILDAEESAYLSPLAFLMDEGRVLDIMSGKRIFALRFPDVENWQKERLVAFLESHDGELDPVEVKVDAPQKSWDLEFLLKQEFGGYMAADSVFGEIGSLSFMPLSAFSKEFPETYAEMRADEEERAKMDLGARMAERALTFRASALEGIWRLDKMAELQERFVAILESAVARDGVAREYMMPYVEDDALGRIAAAALSDQFTIDATSNLPPFAQQSLAEQGLKGGFDPNVMWIVATSLAPRGEDALRRYGFRFVRDPNAGDAWLLAEFRFDSGTG